MVVDDISYVTKTLITTVSDKSAPDEKLDILNKNQR